jgi:replication factor A3
MHLSEGAFVEIIGSVKDDLTVRALTSFALGDSIDMKGVNAVVEFGHSSVGAGVLDART